MDSNIFGINYSGQRADAAIGFYAIEYTLGREALVSYRWTDKNTSFPFYDGYSGNDMYNKYGAFVGNTSVIVGQ